MFPHSAFAINPFQLCFSQHVLLLTIAYVRRTSIPSFHNKMTHVGRYRNIARDVDPAKTTAIWRHFDRIDSFRKDSSTPRVLPEQKCHEMIC